MAAATVGLAVVVGVRGHGAMTYPTPRNAIDGQLPEFKAWKYPCDSNHQGINCSITFCGNGRNCQGSCPKSAHNGQVDALTADNGQSCYWFSNGCMIGCDKCDGTNNHWGHGTQQFTYKGMTAEQVRANNITFNPWNPAAGDMVLDPKTTSRLNLTQNCDSPTATYTVCDPRLRTINTQAECGSDADVYKFSPWRYPGNAPVIDACGVAGGRYPGQGWATAGADYMNTTLAKQGDMGSKLPAMTPQAVWKVGSAVEAGWTVSAHHGGGYAYRLAPADGPLTEDTFRKLPLDFVGKAALRWGGESSSQIEFDPVARGWQTSSGTVPKGSSWRKFPIPTVLWQREGPSFEPVCQESDECIKEVSQYQGYAWKAGVCKCSGHSNGGPLLPNIEVVDQLQVPADLKPGNYVLQWRWDCEETDQIWASCADVQVTA